MNLLAPSSQGEVLIVIGENWKDFRLVTPKVQGDDRLRLVELMFTASQMMADQLGVTVQYKDHI